MQIVKVKMPHHPYEVQIASGQLNGTFMTGLISRYNSVSDYVIITDAQIFGLYSDWLTDRNVIIVASGESSKCFSMLENVLEQMASFQLTRNGLVIAFGGGVIGDLAGFAASVYKRGIRWIGVPTTLLSMVDSSVGGKVAVNLRAGKNLAGAFHQPEAVFIDPVMLDTLDKREVSNGLAEMVKLGVALDKDYFEALERFPIEKVFSAHELTSHEAERWSDLIRRACEIKAEIVASDERDTGRRMLLNFGHTIGHAIERYDSYRERLHGEAVAMGMWLKCRIAHSEGFITADALQRIGCLLDRCGLKRTLPPMEIDAFRLLLEGIGHDKKQDHQIHEGQVNWVVLRGLGSSTLASVPYLEMMSKLEEAYKE